MANLLKRRRVPFSKCSLFKRYSIKKKYRKARRKSNTSSMSLRSDSSSKFYVEEQKNDNTLASSLRSDPTQVPISSASLLNSKDDMFMQEFLEIARNGNTEQLVEMMKLGISGKNSNSEPINFDLNYRGKSKRFYGWTALHIGCYFNLLEIVKLLTQQPNCEINICNYENDTPLHKACLTSRYEIIELLLMKNADINIKNNEGHRPIDLASDPTIKKLIQAAEKTESLNLQKTFFEAVANNDLDLINKLLNNKSFDLSCQDTFGNTALHMASNRNQCEIAALLMQKGIDTVIKNQNNLTALDLAKTKEMKEILGYMPYNWRKYEGVLMKKRKFLGFKEYYVVLNKGSMIYYQNKKDASKDVNRKGTYYLNNAFIGDYPVNSSTDYPEYSWTVNFTNGRKHTLCSALVSRKKKNTDLNRSLSKESSKSKNQSQKRTPLNPSERKKKWIQAINEHIRFTESQFESQQNENKTLMPMESLNQNLNILKCDEDKLNFLLIQIEQQIGNVKLSDITQLPPQSSLGPIFLNYKKNFENLKSQIKILVEDSNKCLNLHEQRESLLKSQLNETRVKCELLEQSLRVLAQENHDMESKKLHRKAGTSNGTSQNNFDLQISETRDISTEEEIVNDGLMNDDSDDESEEFFDIADDFTDEDDKSNDFLGSDTNQPVYFENADAENRNKQNSPVSKLINISENTPENDDPSSEGLRTSVAKLSPNMIEVDTQGWRLKLPAPMIDRSQISIWSILKQSIGKDLSKITLPAAWCEPLSFLQRVTENFYYSDLVNKASDPNIGISPAKRMEYIATYAVTNISSNIDRLSKPFNPLMGETYELTREDLGFRIVCEQVSHHPPISAFHVDSTNKEANWKFYGEINPKTKFWGKSIEVYPKGTLTLELNKFNETYTWQSVTCCVHNIIVGKLWFEYYGSMEIVCHQTGYKAIINFKPYSWSNKELHKFDGYIYDNKKNKLKALYGYWTHCVYSCDVGLYESFIKSGKRLPTVEVDKFFSEVNNTNNLPSHSSNNLEDASMDSNKKQMYRNSNASSSLTSNPDFKLLNAVEVWRADSRPSYADEYYSFNYFTMTLNEMKDEFKNIIAPTDCRFRTDIKQLEIGNLDKASQEKTRLEENQRERRRTQTEDYKGKWFKLKKHPFVKDESWTFTDEYWNRNYSNCLQLY